MSGRLTLRRGLIIVQVALSMIVLTTAVLFARNLVESTGLQPGFDLDRTLYVSIRLVPENYPDLHSREAFIKHAHSAVAALPGVESAASTAMIPFNDDTTHGGGVRIDNSGDVLPIVYHFNRVGPGYFRTLGVPVLAGREFLDQDVNAVVINESFARRAFGGESAIGRRLRLGDSDRVVAGVVRDSKYAWMGDKQRPAAFELFRPDPAGGRGAVVQFMIRASVDPDTLVRPLSRTAMALDTAAAVEVKPMRNAMAMALLPSRAGAALLGIMGSLGLALTGIGLYGVMAYAVARRVREIGLRVALGAPPSRVLTLVFGEGAWLVGIGLTLGLAASYFVTRPLSQFLVEGVPTTDPLTYAIVSGLMVAAGWLACAVPARRALRIDPMEALRYE